MNYSAESPFHQFLIRTNLLDVYKSLLKENDHFPELSLTMEDNATYNAIMDAFHCSEEYEWMESETKLREEMLCDEAKDSIKYESAEYDCCLQYGAGTNGLYRTDNYRDTKTICCMRFKECGIEATVDREGVCFFAAGNAELNCLIDAFIGMAHILIEQKDKNKHDD